jgi:hypothetical protein
MPMGDKLVRSALALQEEGGASKSSPVTHDSAVPGSGSDSIGNRYRSTRAEDNQVHVVDIYSDRLDGITPSPQGDLSAGQAAVLSGLWSGAASTPGMSGIAATTMHIDEILRAENAFLEVCDLMQVSGRLKSIAEARSERYECFVAPE